MPRSPKGERRVARSPFRPLQSPSLALNPATKACHGRPCRPRGRINDGTKSAPVLDFHDRY